MKIKSLPVLLIIIFIITSASILYETFAEDINLEKLLKLVESNNLEVINKKDNLKYTGYQIDEVKSATRPSIELTSNYSYLKNQFTTSPSDNIDYKISLTQPLFTYGKLSKAIKIANYTYKNSEFELSDIIKQKSYEGAALLYTIKLLELKKKILLNTQKSLKEHYSNVKIRFETGAATRLDVLTAKVNYKQIKPKLIQIDNSIINTVNSLKLLLNMESNSNINVTEHIQIDNFINPDEKTYLQQALKNSERINILKENIKITEMQKKISQNNLRPGLTLISNYGGNLVNAVDFFPVNNEEYLIGVSLNFPLFDGFKSRNQIKEYGIRTRSIKRQIELISKTIANSIKTEVNNINQYKNEISTNTLVLEQAEEAYRVAEENYKAGDAINIDVIESERNRTAAKIGLTESKYNYIMSLIRLKNLIGIKLNHPINSRK